MSNPCTCERCVRTTAYRLIRNAAKQARRHDQDAREHKARGGFADEISASISRDRAAMIRMTVRSAIAHSYKENT